MNLWYKKLGFHNNPFNIKPGAYDNELVAYNMPYIYKKIDNGDMVFIEGYYGSGKTTILKNIINKNRPLNTADLKDDRLIDIIRTKEPEKMIHALDQYFREVNYGNEEYRFDYYSNRHQRRLIKEAFGVARKRLEMLERFKKTRLELTIHPEKKLSEIALELGFTDNLIFLRSFRNMQEFESDTIAGKVSGKFFVSEFQNINIKYVHGILR